LIVQSQNDSKKCESYVIDIKIENCENDLQETFNN